MAARLKAARSNYAQKAAKLEVEAAERRRVDEAAKLETEADACEAEADVLEADCVIEALVVETEVITMDPMIESQVLVVHPTVPQIVIAPRHSTEPQGQQQLAFARPAMSDELPQVFDISSCNLISPYMQQTALPNRMAPPQELSAVPPQELSATDFRLWRASEEQANSGALSGTQVGMNAGTTHRRATSVPKRRKAAQVSKPAPVESFVTKCEELPKFKPLLQPEARATELESMATPRVRPPFCFPAGTVYLPQCLATTPSLWLISCSSHSVSLPQFRRQRQKICMYSHTHHHMCC